MEKDVKMNIQRAFLEIQDVFTLRQKGLHNIKKVRRKGNNEKISWVNNFRYFWTFLNRVVRGDEDLNKIYN